MNEFKDSIVKNLQSIVKTYEESEIGMKECDDLLDKIRDEICDIDDEIVLNPDSFYDRKVYVRFSKVINIIDKYRKESEDAE